MKGVPVLVFVNPADPADLWIDWDGAYRAHEPAWEREARIRRGVGERSNLYDRAWERISNPLAGKARAPDELDEIQRRVEAERPPPPTPAPPHPLEERLKKLQRIQQTGRQTRATVVRHDRTDREMFGAPIVMVAFDVDGREVLFEHCYGPRHLKHYKVGREVEVWVDPDNPDAICPGR